MIEGIRSFLGSTAWRMEAPNMFGALHLVLLAAAICFAVLGAVWAKRLDDAVVPFRRDDVQEKTIAISPATTKNTHYSCLGHREHKMAGDIHRYDIDHGTHQHQFIYFAFGGRTGGSHVDRGCLPSSARQRTLAIHGKTLLDILFHLWSYTHGSMPRTQQNRIFLLRALLAGHRDIHPRFPHSNCHHIRNNQNQRRGVEEELKGS